jgi:hypothetical protein
MRDRRQTAVVSAVVMGILALATSARAADGDDTLRSYLAKSDLVVLGEITSEPSEFMKEIGVANYVCDFKIAQVLKGNKPAGDTVRVNIVRFERDEEDRLVELKKGSKCILFLKKAAAGETPLLEDRGLLVRFSATKPLDGAVLEEACRTRGGQAQALRSCCRLQ